MTDKLLTLRADNWYAWEMFPGYGGERYYSPIKVYRVEPMGTGEGILRLAFHNACYAEGVQNFVLDLKILHRSEYYLLARLIYGPDSEPDRCVVVCPITVGWLHRHFPAVLKCQDLPNGGSRPSVDAILDELFE